MATDSTSNANENLSETKKLAQDVHWITHATFWSQVALGIIGIVALWIYHGQLDEMRKATEANTQALNLARDSSDISDGDFERTIRQTIHQTSAQLKSADTGEKSRRDALENFRRDERAWVGISDYHVESFDRDSGLIVYVLLANSGKTPAHDISVGFSYVLSPAKIDGPSPDLVTKLVFQPIPSIAPQGKYIYHVGNRTVQDASANTSARSIVRTYFDAIQSGQMIIYYFGEFKYIDLTGRTRTTELCLYLSDPAKKEMSACDKFNDLN